MIIACSGLESKASHLSLSGEIPPAVDEKTVFLLLLESNTVASRRELFDLGALAKVLQTEMSRHLQVALDN